MNDFDKNIKKKLYNSQMPVSDGLWASIESQIPVKKEQPKYWLLFLLCACSISFGILTSDKSILSSSDTAELVQNTEAHKGQQTIIIEDRTSVTSLKTESKTGKSATSDPLKGTDNFLKKNTRNDQVNKFLKSSNPTYNQLLTKANPVDELKEETSLLASAFNSSKKLKFVNNPFKSASDKSSSNPGNKSVFKLIEKSRIYKVAEPINTLTALGKQYYNKGVSINKAIQLSDYGKSLPTDKYSVAACPSFEPYSSGLYFYTDITTAYNFQKLQVLNPEYSGVESLRNERESGAVSISANVGLGKQWTSGFLVETGLNYDRISINSKPYSDDAPPRLIITIDSILTPSGYEITRDSSYAENGNGGMAKNTFSQFNVPVVFGYETFLSDRISLVAKAGVLINIASRNRGQVSNAEGDLVHYESDNVGTSMFKTNMGLSYTGSIQFQSEITPLLAAYTGLNVSYYPDNFGLSTNPIKQTYTKLGLSAGVKYRL